MLCLQGGGEFSPRCRAMDAVLVDAAPGPVVVTALGVPSGADYRTASGNGVGHFRALGATDVVAAPDAREDADAALAVLREARLVVLPGGSPARLLDALVDTGVGQVVTDLLAAGGSVMGSSAGAMVLCEWTVLPDRRGPQGTAVARALGAAPGLVVVPHWNGGSSRGDWLRAIEETVPSGTEVVGLREESGVLVRNGEVTAVGRASTALVTAGRELARGETWRRA